MNAPQIGTKLDGRVKRQAADFATILPGERAGLGPVQGSGVRGSGAVRRCEVRSASLLQIVTSTPVKSGASPPSPITWPTVSFQTTALVMDSTTRGDIHLPGHYQMLHPSTCHSFSLSWHILHHWSNGCQRPLPLPSVGDIVLTMAH